MKHAGLGLALQAPGPMIVITVWGGERDLWDCGPPPEVDASNQTWVFS